MEGFLNQSTVSLDQWRAIVAVADERGLHAAGRRIGRSHSAVAQAVRKAEEALGLAIFAVEGRVLVPTEEGRTIIHRARALLGTARELEDNARRLAEGWEGEITLVVDGIVDLGWLVPRLAAFATEARGTRLRVRHEVMTGAARAVQERTADVVLTGTLPLGAMPAPVLRVTFTPVAAPGLAASVAAGSARQLVVADTAESEDVRGWLRPSERWTCPTFEVAIALAKGGFGLCIAPHAMVADAIARGELVDLGMGRPPVEVQVHVQLPRGDGAGPAARALARCLR